MSRMISCWRSSEVSRTPKARLAVLRSAVITAREKYGGTASSSARMRSRSPADCRGAEEVGQRQRRAQVGAAAAALGRVAVALEHAGLVVAHPLHDRRVGEVVAFDHDVDLARHAGRLLERLEVLHGGQVLRDEPVDVGHHLGPAVEPPADDRERRPTAEHAARPPQRAAHGRVAGAAARARRAGAPSRRAAASVSSPAPRSERASPPSRGRSDSAAVPAVSASAKAIAMPATSSAPNPRTIGTGESSSTRKPTPVASAAVAITGTATRAARSGAALLLHARLVLDRVVDARARAAPAARRSRPSSAAGRAARSPRT